MAKQIEEVEATVKALENSESDGDADLQLATLAEQARGGHAVALREIIAWLTKHRFIERQARRILPYGPADVEDVVQRTLEIMTTKAMTDPENFYQGSGSFLGWIRMIARNEALQIVRRQNTTAKVVDLEALGGELAIPSWTSVVVSKADLAAAIDRLTAEHQEILDLRERAGLTYEQIAVQLGLPINTVRSRLARARQQLREILAGVNGEEAGQIV